MTSKNWRDIDLAKDRGVKNSKKASALEERAQKQASSQAKKDLEKLFSGSTVNKEKAAELEAIKAVRGQPDFYKKMDDYVAKYGLPREWEFIQLFLDHKDAKLVVDLLKSMEGFISHWPVDRQQLLAQKLRVLEVSSFDRDLTDQIRVLKKQLPAA